MEATSVMIVKARNRERLATGRVRAYLSHLATSDLACGRRSDDTRALMESTDLHQNLQKGWLHLRGPAKMQINAPLKIRQHFFRFELRLYVQSQVGMATPTVQM